MHPFYGPRMPAPIYAPSHTSRGPTGSQTGSQRSQALSDAGRRPATVSAAICLFRRQWATSRDGETAPHKEGSLVRTRLRPLRGFHVSVRPIFTFGSDIPVGTLAWPWLLPVVYGSCLPGGLLCVRGGFRACCRRLSRGARVLPEALVQGAVPLVRACLPA